MDVHDARLSGTLEQALHLRAGQAELLGDLFLRVPVDIRPVRNPGKQLVVVRGQVVGQRRDLVTRVSICSVSGRLLTLQSPILDHKVPMGAVSQGGSESGAGREPA